MKKMKKLKPPKGMGGGGGGEDEYVYIIIFVHKLKYLVNSTIRASTKSTLSYFLASINNEYFRCLQNVISPIYISAEHLITITENVYIMYHAHQVLYKVFPFYLSDD